MWRPCSRQESRRPIKNRSEHADKLAEPTVEGESPMSEIKRPKSGPTIHIRRMYGAVEYTERMSGTVECPGRMPRTQGRW